MNEAKGILAQNKTKEKGRLTYDIQYTSYFIEFSRTDVGTICESEI